MTPKVSKMRFLALKAGDDERKILFIKLNCYVEKCRPFIISKKIKMWISKEFFSRVEGSLVIAEDSKYIKTFFSSSFCLVCKRASVLTWQKIVSIQHSKAKKKREIYLWFLMCLSRERRLILYCMRSFNYNFFEIYLE